MTYEEAIKLLHPDTRATSIASLNFINGVNRDATFDEVDDACILACEALEKQIPKKAVQIENHYFPETYDYDYSTAKCPNCKTDFSFDETYMPTHCDKCGQAIDWSDEEDD